MNLICGPIKMIDWLTWFAAHASSHSSREHERAAEIKALMSRTIERTQFMWEKGRGDKCCPGPESCLPCARPVLGASVSEWHIRPWDGCHGAQRQGGVYLCQAPGGMVARGSGCAHRFSPKLGNPGIASVWDWRVVASNTYPRNRLLRKT